MNIVNGTTGPGDAPNAQANVNLQSYIELVYVQTANSVMVSQMASLESSLSVTTKAMSLLATIQNLHNMVAPVPKGSFLSAYPQDSWDTDAAQYQRDASAFFGTPVKIAPAYGPGGVSAFLAQMASVKMQISAMIPGLSAATPSGATNPNSLLATLKVVLSNINSTGAALTASGAALWLIDKNNASNASGVASAGVYQQNITNAITAGQSLNTTQTEAVRNFLYIYQEYYQSAAAVLQQMTQTIEKMASNIAR